MGARSIAAGNEANGIGGELMKQVRQIIDAGRNTGAQPARQALSDGSARAVELVEGSDGRAQHMRRAVADVPPHVRQAHPGTAVQQGCRRGPWRPGSVRVCASQLGDEVQAILDPFERFLDAPAPALVMERGEIPGRPSVGIEQIGVVKSGMRRQLKWRGSAIWRVRRSSE